MTEWATTLRPGPLIGDEEDELTVKVRHLRQEVRRANIGPIHTPQLLSLHAALDEIVESNRHDGNKTKPAVLVDAHPGLGKSTAVARTAATCSGGRSPRAGRRPRPEPGACRSSTSR